MNSLSSVVRHSSANDGTFGGTKRLRSLRQMNASSLCRSVALVKPHQALEAYVSLATTTVDILSVDRYRPCHEHAVFLRHTKSGELIAACTCSATDRLLVSVTPRTFMLVTRAMFVIGSGGCTVTFRLLSTKIISTYLAGLTFTLLAHDHTHSLTHCCA